MSKPIMFDLCCGISSLVVYKIMRILMTVHPRSASAAKHAPGVSCFWPSFCKVRACRISALVHQLGRQSTP